jgi:hypothetical protein
MATRAVELDDRGADPARALSLQGAVRADERNGDDAIVESRRDRTEVGQVQDVALGPTQAVVLTHFMQDITQRRCQLKRHISELLPEV